MAKVPRVWIKEVPGREQRSKKQGKGSKWLVRWRVRITSGETKPRYKHYSRSFSTKVEATEFGRAVSRKLAENFTDPMSWEFLCNIADRYPRDRNDTAIDVLRSTLNSIGETDKGGIDCDIRVRTAILGQGQYAVTFRESGDGTPRFFIIVDDNMSPDEQVKRFVQEIQAHVVQHIIQPSTKMRTTEPILSDRPTKGPP